MDPIDIRPIKNIVRARLDPGSPLRECIMAENDFMSGEEYIYKIKTWLRLLEARDL